MRVYCVSYISACGAYCHRCPTPTIPRRQQRAIETRKAFAEPLSGKERTCAQYFEPFSFCSVPSYVRAKAVCGVVLHCATLVYF